MGTVSPPMDDASRQSTCHTILGLDLAVAPENSGVALAQRDGDDEWRLQRLFRGSREPLLGQILAILDDPRPLICIDSPLGWPAALADGLRDHRAGEPLPGEPQTLFNRYTDVEIRQRLRKKPLEVGADRIARTAVAALTLLEALRQALGQPLPLLLGLDEPAVGKVIETYPAGTLRAHQVESRGYKRPDGETVRGRLASWLAEGIAMDEAQQAKCVASDHVLDAVLCVRAGLDVLAGEAVAPEDLALARREGWIWCRGA
ncbi:hypothetical protein J2T57_001136 [Natronocella acetinitrilica]|uniref:DUF429 domain-containing protein n=1 Tax=Natronocella acetinitrilica TaxID=414046 RepID=A0AAE3G552_9GAMM|nr:hypothetical protein [Natronocella acetinitrilica]